MSTAIGPPPTPSTSVPDSRVGSDRVPAHSRAVRNSSSRAATIPRAWAGLPLVCVFGAALSLGLSLCVTQANAEPEPTPIPAPPVPAARAMPRDALPAAAEQLPLRYVIEGIAVSGNLRTAETVILRFIPFRAGDILDVEDPRLELTRYRLLGTGFFRDVALSLSKGSRRGRVILKVDVVERNTIVVNDVWMGLSASADTEGQQRNISSFGGIDIAETNLLGTGVTLGVATAFSADQQAYALRFYEPAFLGGNWMLDGELYHNNGLGFFGNSNVLWDDPSQLNAVRRPAVVGYRRRGATVGAGRDLSVSTQVWAHFRVERLFSSQPRAAAHDLYGQTEPLQFNMLKGPSLQSTLRLSLLHDTRDQPVLPTRGWNLVAFADIGLHPLISDYGYQRIDARATYYWPLAYNHVASVSAFLGVISGDAPFIDQYYVGDLSDFRPERVLGLAFDDRPAPNFLGTTVAESRYGDYAAKVVGEYRVPLYRGSRSVYGMDLFLGGGFFALSSQRLVERPPSNKHGAARLPIDLTASLGVRLDTSLGGFSLSISNLLGFAPLGRTPTETE